MRSELLQAAALLQRDTPEATAEAIALLQNTVYSFSMKVCGHPEDAEDTTQEVLFRSLKYFVKIQEPRALAVWLYKVTRNRCWRMRRKPANAPAHTLSLDELMPDEAELEQLLQTSAEGSPESQALQSEQKGLLQKAILRVPPQLRIVLVLHDMEELDTDLVANILDLQPGTVRVRLHRARLAVRKEMNRLLEAESVSRSAPSPPRRSAHSAKKRPEECRSLFAGLSEYLDGRVEPLPCEKMRNHIEGCPRCVAFLRDLRGAIDRCRAMTVPCNAAVSARLQTLLTGEYHRMMGLAQNSSPEV